MRIFGYIRVSSQDQNEDRQVLAMHKLGIKDKDIFIDKQSGKDFNRPRYRKMVAAMRPGDLLYVHAIDRLGRNYDEIQEQWRYLTREIKVDICVMDMPLLDTRRREDLMGTFVADLVLQVLSFVAHSERDSIRKRQAEGIAAAHIRGVRFGRPVLPVSDDFIMAVTAVQENHVTISEAAEMAGMSRSTFYRRMCDWEEEQQHIG